MLGLRTRCPIQKPAVVIALSLLLGLATRGEATSRCERELRRRAQTSSYLVGMAGNASGSELARQIDALGFQTLHLRFEDVDPHVARTFPQRVFAREWVFSPSELPRIAAEIGEFTHASGRPLRGASPGVDLAVYAVDFVSAALGLPANSIEMGDWRSDKVRVNTQLEGADVPTPFTKNFDGPETLLREADTLPYPVVVKPRRGSGSVGAGTFYSAAELKENVTALVEESQRRHNSTPEIMVQARLQPAGYIPFINTVSYRRKNGQVRRIVTGIWENVRGEEFPAEVWDAIYMVPSERFLSGARLALFQQIQKTDRSNLDLLGAEVGTNHDEYMGNPLQLIDANWRLPGLDSSRLEWLATGVNPYHLEIASRAMPELLDEFPEIYTFQNEIQPALVFVRSHDHGTLTLEGEQWFNQQSARGEEWLAQRQAGNFEAPAHPVVVRRGGIKAGAPIAITVNGRTLVEWLQVIGRDRASVEAFVRDVRQKERDSFFVTRSRR